MGYMRTAAASVAGALAIVATLAGCGTSETAPPAREGSTAADVATEQDSVSAQGSAATEDGPPERTVVDVPGDALLRRDAPPAGVARQIDFFAEGGMDMCDEPAGADGLAIGLFADEVPRAEPIDGRPLRVGDAVGLCVFSSERGGLAELRVRTPRGTRPPRTFAVDEAQAAIAPLVVVDLRPHLGAGKWTFEVRYRGDSVTRAVEVLPALAPGYRIVRSSRTAPEALIVGVAPEAPFEVHVYRAEASSPSMAPTSAVHATTIGGRADGDGSATVRFADVPAKTCFTARVRVDGKAVEGTPYHSTFCGP